LIQQFFQMYEIVEKIHSIFYEIHN
jgi:hypothetical protein